MVKVHLAELAAMEEDREWDNLSVQTILMRPNEPAEGRELH